MTQKNICPKCGVTSVSYEEKRLGQARMVHRDYMPVTFVIRLKPETVSSYIVDLEIERMAVHIRSLDEGKLHYAVDIPLPQDGRVMDLLDGDERIEEWHTVGLAKPDKSVPECASVCDCHVNFR